MYLLRVGGSGEDHDLDEVEVCDSYAEGHNGSVSVMLSSEQYLSVGNRGDSDPGEGGIACDIVKSCLRSRKTISPGNAADQWCWWQELYLSQRLVRQYPSRSRSIGVSEFQDKRVMEWRTAR